MAEYNEEFDLEDEQFINCQYSEKLLVKLSNLNHINGNILDISEIKKAISYAKKYHADQKRLSGEPYYSHPLEVAYILADYLLDTESIICAVLHDVAEDTNSSIEHIAFVFGESIARIINIISNLTNNYKLSKDEVFFKINSAKDLDKKAITIKVIDRLHNMRTINFVQSLKKQQKIARETLHFYIPLAKAANLAEVERELSEIVIDILVNKS